LKKNLRVRKQKRNACESRSGETNKWSKTVVETEIGFPYYIHRILTEKKSFSIWCLYFFNHAWLHGLTEMVDRSGDKHKIWELFHNVI